MDLHQEIPPMYREKYMAHALGGYKGYQLLATEEAFRHSYQCGFRYFEVDLKPTADQKLVCTYGWTRPICERIGMPYDPSFENMTHELFMKQRIHGMPVLDAARLIELMQEFPDTFLEIDLHTLDADQSRLMAELVAEQFCRQAGLDERLLIQVNTKEMFLAIDSVYHFPYYQFNVRNFGEQTDEFIQFSLEHGIRAMALKGKLATPERVKKIRDAGLALLVFTIDSRSRCEEYLRRGANTICTNFIFPGARGGQRDDIVNIAYCSQGHAREGYSALIASHLLPGRLDTLSDGSQEYSLAVNCLTERRYTVADSLFTRAFKRRPKGWVMRGKRGNQKEWRWFCTDNKWHLPEGMAKKNLEKRVFTPGEVIDLYEIYHAGCMVFDAIW
ncbi:MAG: hypothetical protein J6N77_05110 [Lachnospiraceae bacterium]|nr:hypothetical protein [Lachnospiraceae bacterium]